MILFPIDEKTEKIIRSFGYDTEEQIKLWVKMALKLAIHEAIHEEKQARKP